MLRETRNRVRIGEERSEQFWTGRGVKQGCPLSSSLFNLLMADPSPPPRSKAGDEEGRMEIRLRRENIHIGICRRHSIVGGRGHESDDSEVRKICEGEEAGGECGEIKNYEV